MIRFTHTMTGVANASKAMTGWRLKLPKAIDQQMRRQAHRLRAITVKGIRDQAPGGKQFEPLAESTIAMKKSSKALIDNGDLLRSIGVDELGEASYFVGVNRSAQDEDGGELYNLAEIHETGVPPFAIPVTDKMRRFWMAMFIKGVFKAPLKSGTSVIMHGGIKARPFLEPSMAQWATDVERQFTEGLAKSLGVRNMVV